jgi:hypothetical protein
VTRRLGDVTVPTVRCSDEPRMWRWGGILCPSGTRPTLDQLVTHILTLPPAERARWIDACRPRRGPHRRTRKRAIAT